MTGILGLPLGMTASMVAEGNPLCQLRQSNQSVLIKPVQSPGVPSNTVTVTVPIISEPIAVQRESFNAVIEYVRVAVMLGRLKV